MYQRLQDFVAEAINGEHSADEIAEIFRLIDSGVGLHEHDEAMAEMFDHMPKTDADDPVYQRGRDAGASEVMTVLIPALVRCEFGDDGHCPECGYRQVHKGGCRLDVILRAARQAETEGEDEARRSDA